VDEPDIERLIKELAATGVDPFWVYEAIAIEQEAAEAKRSEGVAAAGSRRTQMGRPARPQFRVVVAGLE
jgi:hypothetical protein